MSTSSPFLLSFLAVDPGLGAHGVALYDRGELVRAGSVRSPLPKAEHRGPEAWRVLAEGVHAWLAGVRPDLVLVETMKQYANGRADPDDLLELAGAAGAVVGRLALPAEGVRAATWNGQVPPEVRRLRTAEWVQARGWWDRVNLDTTKRYQQDVWSAIAVGRWKVQGHR